MKLVFEFIKRLFIILLLLALEFLAVAIIAVIFDPTSNSGAMWPIYLILILWLITIIWGFVSKDLNVFRKILRNKPINSNINTRKETKIPTQIYTTSLNTEVEVNIINELKDNVPVKNNIDFNKTVLLERISKKPHVISKDIDSYPIYLREELGLVNPFFEYQKMINEGLIIQATLSNKLLLLDKNELTELSNELNLPTKGLKKDLINRISFSESAESKLIKYIGTSQYFELSETGLKFLQDNSDLIKLSTAYRIDNSKYFKIRETFIKENRQPIFEEIAYIVLQNNVKTEFDNDLHRSVRQSLKELAEMCWNLGRIDEGLFYYIYSIIMNFSCLGNNGYVKNSEYIPSKLRSMKKLSSFDASTIETMTDNVLSKMNLPYQKYSNTTLKIMLMEFYESGTVDIEKYKKFEIKPKYVSDFGSFWKDKDDYDSYELDDDNYE